MKNSAPSAPLRLCVFALDFRPKKPAKSGPVYSKITLFIQVTNPMLEVNPIRSRIKDMQGRVEALRGYL